MLHVLGEINKDILDTQGLGEVSGSQRFSALQQSTGSQISSLD